MSFINFTPISGSIWTFLHAMYSYESRPSGTTLMVLMWPVFVVQFKSAFLNIDAGGEEDSHYFCTHLLLTFGVLGWV